MGVCPLVPHQGSAFPDPLLIFSGHFNHVQTKFGTQKRYYDKVLGKTPDHNRI